MGAPASPRSGSGGLVDQHGRGQVFQGAAHGLEDGDGLVAAATRVLATAQGLQVGADVAGTEAAGVEGLEQVAGLGGGFVGIHEDFVADEAVQCAGLRSRW